MVSHFDTMAGSTYKPYKSTIEADENRLRSPQRHLNQVKYAMDYQGKQSPEVHKFFQNSYASPPKKYDSRINKVLRDAEV